MNPDEFATFRHDAVHSLMRLNDACDREFQLSSWPRWDYDFERGTLTFSKDDIPRVVASIQVVGSTSETSGTWLWSWANESLPAQVTNEMERVRAFGETEGLLELTRQSAPDDEYLGWGMSAIAAKVLDSKGAYRCPGENGFIYLVYADLSFAETANTQPDVKQIQCSTHGVGYQSYVCEHLLSNPAQEWFSESPSEGNRWPDAWCATCNRFFQEEGEWNDKNESKIRAKLLCHYCYESFRSKSPTKNW